MGALCGSASYKKNNEGSLTIIKQYEQRLQQMQPTAMRNNHPSNMCSQYHQQQINNNNNVHEMSTDQTHYNSLLLLYGYIRIYIKKLHIPNDIKQLIHQHLFIAFKFYKPIFRENTEFENNTVKKILPDGNWSTCLLNDYAITDSICNKFEIEYLWKSSMHQSSYFFIGFTNSMQQTAWNIYLGIHKNQQHSVGLLVGKQFDCFYLYGGNYNGHEILSYRSNNMMDVGHRFLLSFNFSTSQCTLYHNGNKSFTFMFHPKRIIPALSLFYKGEEVEITKWKYFTKSDKNQTT